MSRGSRCDVAAFGDLLLDVVLRVEEEIELKDVSYVVKDGWASPGGSAANFSVALSRLGLRTCLVSTVGNDILGYLLTSDLEKEGVDVGLVRVLDGESTGFTVSIVSPRGTRTLVTYRGASRNNVIDPERVRRALEDAKLVFISGYAVRNTDGGESIVRLAKLGSELGVETAIDLGGFGREHLPKLPDLRGIISYVFLNAEELRILVDCEELSGCVRTLYENISPRAVFIKAGSEGSIVFDGSEVVRVEPYSVDVVDPTGCGDAYNAGVVLGILRGHSAVRAAELGNLLGAYKVQGRGSRYLPRSLRELEEFKKSYARKHLGS
ncbi:MAG: PfkB family carbohydrate kinase [Sulfolobales archaeon]|nr:PfkB family carbohydrate kinase [Sulfolobales archaeon]MCX8208647.1 PfkB family carbohydrate kinase [Sulfolobales archaeon]MDW8010783.1 PfkB family carbohydrate kinase [Sulfolobales archaeon]